MESEVPIPPPPPTPPTPPPPPSVSLPQITQERGALLDSINHFAKNKLKKSKTNDRSGPLTKSNFLN